MLDRIGLSEARQVACQDLLRRMHPSGHWTGQLASSALSTATAVSALAVFQRHADRNLSDLDRLIRGGMEWLADRQNEDGGWGDTDQSYSNISTTMLVASAFQLTAVPSRCNGLLDRADRYIESQGGVKGLRRRYGKDKTFAVPILANCALAGRVGWSQVSSLPFELASFPQSFYRFLRLPVVSYAIPALVAIGQAKFHHHRPWNPITRIVRSLTQRRTLDVLQQIQPASGGYLEAIPLTSFVVMSLAAVGRAAHPVVERGVEFLRATVRDDGSWPIDTNLATWNTTLSIQALAAGGEPLPDEVAPCLDWILACQNKTRHPFTGADPGGWGWSDLSGAVPDADDTPSALLALRRFFDSPRITARQKARIRAAVQDGLRWLLGLQNRDGGWPTFCRGWGKLPFDRSGTDLTAHAIRAINAWRECLPVDEADRAIARGFHFLQKNQRPDGAWIPLWFGNQDMPDDENPVYGTSKVLKAYHELGRLQSDPAMRGARWLIEHVNSDHGWGGRRKGSSVSSSVEETALAVESLIPFVENEGKAALVVENGTQWLIEAVSESRHLQPSPIGFYFAKLWYYEQLYPLIYATSALGHAARMFPGLPREAAPCIGNAY